MLLKGFYISKIHSRGVGPFISGYVPGALSKAVMKFGLAFEFLS
jgi:hypothetical protein